MDSEHDKPHEGETPFDRAVTPTLQVDPLTSKVHLHYQPLREQLHNEISITFYCARERLGEMMEYRHVFGDRDFTRSLSRFLTAGCHWMANNVGEVSAAQALAIEVEDLERQRAALKATIARMYLPNTTRPWWRRIFG